MSTVGWDKPDGPPCTHASILSIYNEKTHFLVTLPRTGVMKYLLSLSSLTFRIVSSLPPRLPNGIVAKHLSLFFSAVARNEAGFVNGEISVSAWQTVAQQLAHLAPSFRGILSGHRGATPTAADGGSFGGNPLHAFASANS